MKTYFASACLSALLLFCLNAQAQSLKIAYTQIDYIMAQTPESKQITSQLTIQQTQAENELKRMQKELQDKFGLYQKEAGTMSDEIRKDRETELQSLQTRIQQFSQNAQSTLQNKYKEMVGPVMGKIQQAIDSVAKEQGYNYVINAGGASNDVLYASEDHNISLLVLKKLGITPAPMTEPASTAAKKTPVTAPAKPAPTKKK